jgi:hypothetical protein
MRALAFAAVLVLSGCASDFQKVIEQVKENCHTTIDAQIQAGLTGLQGGGRFQQECWPTGHIEAIPNG